MKKVAVVFARVSSITDRQNTDRQIADLTKYAKNNDFEVLAVFNEQISGGKKNLDRPVLNECLSYCIDNKVDILLVSELSRLGRNAFEVLETIKYLIDNKINVYFQKEQITLLDNESKPSMFAPIMIATLSTCAEIERENIKFRLNSGRQNYIAKGGTLGRHVGYKKPIEKKKEEYKQVISLLKKGNSIRNTAKLANVGFSTVQRVKKEFSL